jgi:hypothetical protein
MAQPLSLAMPPDLVFADGYKIRVVALDPTTGAAVAPVTLQNVTFQIEVLSGDTGDLQFGPFMLVPGPGA